MGSDDQRTAFVAAVGPPAEQMVISRLVSTVCTISTSTTADGALETTYSAENVLELVREKAARERRELAESDLTLPGWDRSPASGFALAELDSVLGAVPPGNP